MINYVIEQEMKVDFIKADINRLWHNCYEYIRVNDGYVTKIKSESKSEVEIYNDGYATKETVDDVSYSEPVYRQELRRRPSCTDQDVNLHKQRKLDLRNFINNTVQGVRIMAKPGESYVNAIDHEGYSAQNYCYTSVFYNELREQGASFQWCSWTYFGLGCGRRC